MLNILEGILGGDNCGSFEAPPDKDGKHVIIDVAGLDENEDAGC